MGSNRNIPTDKVSLHISSFRNLDWIFRITWENYGGMNNFLGEKIIHKNW